MSQNNNSQSGKNDFSFLNEGAVQKGGKNPQPQTPKPNFTPPPQKPSK